MISFRQLVPSIPPSLQISTLKRILPLSHPVDKLNHFPLIFNQHERSKLADVFRALDVLIVLELFEDYVDVDYVVALPLLVFADDLIFKCLIVAAVEDRVD